MSEANNNIDIDALLDDSPAASDIDTLLAEPEQTPSAPPELGVAEVAQAGAEVLGSIGKSFVDNIPGYNRVASGINAVGYAATDALFSTETKSMSQHWDNVKKQYSGALNQYTAESLDVRKNNPAEAFIGDGLAMMAPGAIAAKVGAVLKAEKVAKFLRPITQYMGVGMTRAVTKAAYAGAYAAGDTAAGVLQHKYLESQDLTPNKLDVTDTLDMFALSFGARGALGFIPTKRGAGTVLRDQMAKEISDEGLTSNILSRTATKGNTAYTKHVDDLVAKGVPEEVIHKESMEYFKEIGATNPENFTKPNFLKRKAMEVTDSVGKKMDDVLTKLNDTFGQTKVGFDDSFDYLKKKRLDENTSGIMIQKVLNPAEEALTEILTVNGKPKNLTIKQLWNEIKDLKKLKLAPDVKSEVEAALRKTLSNYTDDYIGATSANQAKLMTQQKNLQEIANAKAREVADISNNLRLLESAKEQTPETLEKIKTLTSQYNVAAKAEQELMSKAADTSDILNANPAAGVRKASEGAPDYVKAINVAEEAAQFKKLSQKYFRYKNLNKVVKSMDPPKNADEALFSSIRGALGNVRNIPKYMAFGKAGVLVDAAYQVSSPIVRKAVKDAALANPQAFAQQAEKVASFLDVVDSLPDDPFVRGLFTKFSAELTSEEISEQELIKKTGSYYAKANLYVNPIQRNMDSANFALEKIMLIADDVAPQLNDAIANALALEEAAPLSMPEIMDQMSKIPELKRFFEPGQGWDGILYGQDREAAAAQIMSDRYLPTATRNALINEVMTTGKLPDISQFERKPKQFAPRDKSKKAY